MPELGTVKYPRTIPRDEQCAKELKKPTLTNLYNQQPSWLAKLHRQLDENVFAAYGWSPTMTDDELLAVAGPYERRQRNIKAIHLTLGLSRTR